MARHKWHQEASESASESASEPATEAPVDAERESHTPFYPYPTDIPAEVLTICVDALRGRLPDKKEGVHAVMHVISYGLGKWDPEKPEYGAATEALPDVEEASIFKAFAHDGSMTPEQAADVLENAGHEGRKATMGRVPWDVLIPILIAFLKRWLAS